MRIFDHKRVWILNQKLYEQAVELLINNVKPLEIQAVIGIARGGSKLGRDLAEWLNLAYYEVGAKHNKSDDLYSKTKSTVKVDLKSLRTVGNHETLLLVDDICGTGSTINEVVQNLKDVKEIKRLFTLTLCRNVGSAIEPNLYIWPVSDWVIFPWESSPPDGIAELLPQPKRVFKHIDDFYKK